ncbi:hypothetical protein CUMW_125920 [Citrus unshiu]|nr:hypothetical protein CUMW_125920 [Citrus unshiu]
MAIFNGFQEYFVVQVLLWAQLLEVRWFNVMGKIETKILYPQTNYKAYLVLKFSGPRDGFDGRIFESKILF